MEHTSKELISLLQLQPHPEGGYYKETYRASEFVDAEALPYRFASSRSFSTAIYFLLEENNFSAFHRIKSDETWHFYAGDALEVLEISPANQFKCNRIGSDLKAGELFQYTVPSGNWFASRVRKGGSYSLVGCTVAPGFDFRDFELAKREALLLEYPDHAKIIRELTR